MLTQENSANGRTLSTSTWRQRTTSKCSQGDACMALKRVGKGSRESGGITTQQSRDKHDE
jgi:hypothetical protein